MLFLTWISLNLEAFEKLKQPEYKTVSIIIPCHFKHAPLLMELLEAYTMQSVQPNEVIVSLSEADRVSASIITSLSEKKWPFHFILLKHQEPVSEGENRNRACDAAKGDMMICNDADDLPHPQRVEVIKYFFDNFPIDFLIHTYTQSIEDWTVLNPSEIPFVVPKMVNEGGPHANGAVTVSQKIKKRLSWNPAFQQCVDAQFNEWVYHLFPNRMLIRTPIYLYRSDLSSYK